MSNEHTVSPVGLSDWIKHNFGARFTPYISKRERKRKHPVATDDGIIKSPAHKRIRPSNGDSTETNLASAAGTTNNNNVDAVSGREDSVGDSGVVAMDVVPQEVSHDEVETPSAQAALTAVDMNVEQVESDGTTAESLHTPPSDDISTSIPVESASTSPASTPAPGTDASNDATVDGSNQDSDDINFGTVNSSSGSSKCEGEIASNEDEEEKASTEPPPRLISDVEAAAELVRKEEEERLARQKADEEASNEMIQKIAVSCLS